jgi:hypothetical protein
MGWNLVEDHVESCLAAPTLELEACIEKDLSVVDLLLGWPKASRIFRNVRDLHGSSLIFITPMNNMTKPGRLCPESFMSMRCYVIV